MKFRPHLVRNGPEMLREGSVSNIPYKRVRAPRLAGETTVKRVGGVWEKRSGRGLRTVRACTEAWFRGFGREYYQFFTPNIAPATPTSKFLFHTSTIAGNLYPHPPV